MRRRHGPTLAALLLLTFHFASFDFRDLPLVTDARYYSYIAWRITEGEVPHLDVFDNKTQLTSFVAAGFHAVADTLGTDPLIAIRLGYLAGSVLGGMLAFFVYRQLAGSVAGLLGVLAYCSFNLMGVLPSIGPTPKLWMSVAASAGALLVRRGQWFWAGVVGALAFMDWQIGVLVWIAAFASAAVLERRWRPVLQVAAGGAAGLAPFLLYYAWNGALGATFAQVVTASLFRGTEVAQLSTLETRLHSVAVVSDFALRSQAPVFYASALGIPMTIWWLWRRIADRRLLLPLAIYHFGVVAFSLIDFQWYGDFFLLLHTAAFFLAMLYIGLYEAIASRIAASDRGPQRRTVLAIAACAVVALLARPGPLQPELQLRRVKPAPYRGASLHDQREVAAILAERIGDKRVAFLEHSEMLFLMPRANTVPAIFWNRPTWSYFRRSEDESTVETAVRMVRSVDPDVVVVPLPRPRRVFDPVKQENVQFVLDYAPVLEGYDVEYIISASERFRVVYGIRLDGTERRPPGVRSAQAPALDPERVEELRALGYADVGEPLAADAAVGVRVFDRRRARPGLNLFTDATACQTHLMDLEGKIAHSWSLEPCFRWDNTVLLPSGDLLVTTREKKGETPAESDAARHLVRLGWNGEVRWKKPLTVHHDVELTPRGEIVVLSHRFRRTPAVHAEIPLRDHLLIRLSPEGEVLGELSLWDLIGAAPDILALRPVKPRRFEGGREVDLFHSNSVEWMRQHHLAGKDPIYGPDTVLVSIRNQDAFIIFDWKQRRLLWAWGPGEVSNPHDATLLPNGNILAFDNGLGRDWSRVIELDPLSREIVWEYQAPDRHSFYSRSRGANQRLSGGNTLITESDSGRVFEVTAEGDVVWEFVNPNLTKEREPGVIVRMRRLEGMELPDLLERIERGEDLPLVD